MGEFSPVALLESSHDRTPSDCGVEPLSAYLKQSDLQNQKKGIVRNYVTRRGTSVVGYDSLAYGSAAQAVAPAALTKGGRNRRPQSDLRTGQGPGRRAVLREAWLPPVAGRPAPSFLPT
ncbi:MAG TPA: hypothetical protein VG125_02175 [Pirellulales bacterium]|nr:hypothetical protein [Pirellulales bacterium]